MRRTARLATVCGLALLLVAPLAASAQNTPALPPSPRNEALAGIDSLIMRSRFRDAAAALDRWEGEHANAKGADKASAIMLRARLTTDADSARTLYLALSLGYPSSPEAPFAVMRLGQAAAATGDNARAATYFNRVIADYPNSPLRDDARNALASLGTASGRTSTSNASKSGAAGSASNSGATSSGGSGNRTNASPPAAAPANKPSTDTSGSATAANGAYALQVGAFRDARTAATIARQLTQHGFDARVVTVPANSLSRVRVGRFATSRATADTQRRLRAAGYEAIVVDDARSEVVADR